MVEYEGRKWRFWHHHMALVRLAMLFTVTERKGLHVRDTEADLSRELHDEELVFDEAEEVATWKLEDMRRASAPHREIELRSFNDDRHLLLRAGERKP